MGTKSSGVLVQARDVTVRWTHGTAMGPVSFDATAGLPLAVSGPAGAGRSTLLLALAGRVRGLSGELVVDGVDAVAHPRRLRRSTAVARIGGFAELEPTLSVEDCLTERTLLDAAPPRRRHARFRQACLQLGFIQPDADLRTHRRVGDLTPLEQAQLCVALTAVRPSTLVVVDDVDRGLTLDEQRLLWGGFLRMSADGPVVAAATLEHESVPASVPHVRLSVRKDVA